MTYKKKLIEVALPLEDINREAARENYIYKGNPSGIHKWWAQRPLAACRAVLFASLVDDPSECVEELMKDSERRKAAERKLKGRKKLWDEMTCLLRGRQAAVLEKVKAGGLSAGAQASISAHAPGLPAEASAQAGPEPTLGDIIAEIERERLFDIIRELVKWENSNNETVLQTARAEIMRSCMGNLPAPRPAGAGGPDLFFVYAIECDDGSHYIGQTDDLKRRFFEHWEGKGAGWCKHHKPVRIAHWEEFSSREEAVKREQDLKTGFGRKWLKDLIASGRARQAGPPPVYDPFCGGGSIPLEAQRLGLEAHASDLNPVPVLITKSLIEIPPRFSGKSPVNPEARRSLVGGEVTSLKSRAGKKSEPPHVGSYKNGTWKGAAGLAEDIRHYGQWMRNEAEKRIGHLYPKVKLPKEQGGGEATVIAWLWARTVASPNPATKGAHVPLMRSFWLSTKAGKKTWLEPIIDPKTMTYRFEVRTGSGEPRVGTVSRTGGVCLITGSPMPLEYIRTEGKGGRLRARLIAIVAEGSMGRTYLPPNDDHERVAQGAQPHDLPDTNLPNEALGFRVQNYGMTKHRHLFTNRQLVALTTLCDLVGEARRNLLSDSDNDHPYADAVALYLAFAVSKHSIYGNSLVPWYTKEDRPSMLFGRQAVSMVWDYAEVSPFTEIGGSLDKSISIVADVLENLPANVRVAKVTAKSATDIDGFLQVLFSTDPPYYDNVPYADLSDFFYVWLRRMLLPICPEFVPTVLVPKAEELVADPFRHGGRDEARTFFEKGMGRVFAKMRRATDDRYPTTIYYAFKQAEQDDSEAETGEESSAARTSTGWETFLQGLVDTGWQIDGTWPLRTERTGRMRDNASNALASSIVLVCRSRPKEAGMVSRRDFLAALKKELPDALRAMQKSNIAPVDLAQAAIGPGMAVFSRYERVLETDGSTMTVRAALSEINKSLDEVLAEQEGEFDADTRWALAWFDQNGFNEGAYGVAETLCTAKNTSVAGMVEANILAAKGGKVRLLKMEELDADWNPATDKRLTIWEITHHLIRRLEQGESGAAELIRQLGAKAEVARDLSYRLYTICERRKWAQEAIAYNTLVLSWSDVQRLAEERKTAVLPTQKELI